MQKPKWGAECWAFGPAVLKRSEIPHSAQSRSSHVEGGRRSFKGSARHLNPMMLFSDTPERNDGNA